MFKRIADSGAATEPFSATEKQEKRTGGLFSFLSSFSSSSEKGEKTAGLSGILKRLHLDNIDSGDILLLLILAFLVVEGDNWELALILGLVLFLSLREDDPV